MRDKAYNFTSQKLFVQKLIQSAVQSSTSVTHCTTNPLVTCGFPSLFNSIEENVSVPLTEQLTDPIKPVTIIIT